MTDVVPRVLFVDSWLPAPDQDASSVRTVALLDLLHQIGAEVVFGVGDTPEFRESYSVGLGAYLHQDDVVVGEAAIEEVLRTSGSGFDVVWLSRSWSAARFLEPARTFAPDAVVVYDTQDLAWLRGLRGAKVTGNASLLKSAMLAKRAELGYTEASDVTLVVSEVERDILGREYPDARVDVLSLIHAARPEPAPTAGRNAVGFIGNFTHHPNLGAAEFLVEEVGPELARVLPDVTLEIVGKHAPESLAAAAGANVAIRGHVEDIDETLDGWICSLAPLRYGAGVKGKVVLSLARGVPAICSEVADEGIGGPTIVAEDAAEIVDAIARLANDAKSWVEVSEAGRAHVRNTFSATVARDVLQRVLRMSPTPR